MVLQVLEKMLQRSELNESRRTLVPPSLTDLSIHSLSVYFGRGLNASYKYP